MIKTQIPLTPSRLVSCCCKFVLLTFLAGSFYSCTTSKNTAYFQTLQKDTTLSGFITNDFESKIQKKDILGIVVSSLSPADDAFFNAAAAGGAGAPAGYTVNADGKISFHKLGGVAAEGLTRKELQDKLQLALQPYLKDPIVNVQYMNHKVTVMGAVGGAKIISMPEERMSLIDVLVNSGDITAEGRTDKVMIIREEGTQKRVKHLNLQDHSIFSSPWYYVQPNDIVYISPDEEKKTKEEKKANLQRNISLITAGVTFVFLIVDRLTR